MGGLGFEFTSRIRELQFFKQNVKLRTYWMLLWNPCINRFQQAKKIDTRELFLKVHQWKETRMSVSTCVFCIMKGCCQWSDTITLLDLLHMFVTFVF